MSQHQDIQMQNLLQILEGIPLTLMKNVYVVDLYSGASTSCTCSAEVRNHLPPSHHSATKEIVLLPPAEATSLAALEAQQTLPIQTWVRIKKGLYKGDIGFVKRSNQTGVTLVVAPHEHLYDLPEQSSKKSLFSSELVTLASLALEPIVSPTGVEVGFWCGGHDFIHGLLHLMVPTHLVILVKLSVPDNIAFHMIAGFEQMFIEKTMHLFSAQFWQEFDTVKICKGELSGSQGKLIDIEWQKWTVSIQWLKKVSQCWVILERSCIGKGTTKNEVMGLQGV
ncbi:hypothetical protein EDD16DRAFT_1708452 [Pisolithus croceorrhizus]|nr:hypothetical protein EDD16DRAFT_1708452 [Pisolithus croceorrhizus]